MKTKREETKAHGRLKKEKRGGGGHILVKEDTEMDSLLSGGVKQDTRRQKDMRMKFVQKAK